MATIVTTPKQAVIQALEAKKRLPELEPIIVQDPIAACLYADRVVKGRWEAAESVIASGKGKRIVDFNILDEDNRVSYPNGVHQYRAGPRPQGTDHVKKGNNLCLMVIYMRLAKCRVPAMEVELKRDRWWGDSLQYCEMIYRMTQEIIDLDKPEVCSSMIKNLAMGKVSKKFTRTERIRVCNELHKRMILHSFARGESREVKQYFGDQKKSENHFLIMLSQHDPEMKVGDLIQKVLGG